MAIPIPFARHLICLFLIVFSWSFVSCQSLSATQVAPTQAAPTQAASTPSESLAVIKEHCGECHGESSPAADLSLVELPAIDSDSQALWRRIRIQLASGQMPPPEEDAMDLQRREKLIRWIEKSFNEQQIFFEKSGGPLPVDGNLLAHDRLFSGINTEPGWSPPRFWRRSQPQYDSLMEQLWVLPKLRYEKAHRRKDPSWAGFSYSRPFPELDPESFTNFSGEVNADEAVLKSLLDAGNQIAKRLTSDTPAYPKEIQPPIAAGVPSIRRGSQWEKFKVKPPERPTEFEPFLKSGAAPTSVEMQRAIGRVFMIVLSRQPRPDELERFETFLKKSLTKNGPGNALRGLITALFVSPEFVFRMELGRGPQTTAGRTMLSPEELVYAVGFALSDRGPGNQLWKAAETGRLQSKTDVAREVRRILADDSIEKNPRLRFFQEFFGYFRAVEIFKDKPGWEHEVQYLVRDADLLVESALKRDQHVLEYLLTTDRYFVAYPNIKDRELFEAIQQKTIDETKKGIARQQQRGREIKPNRNKIYSRAWAYKNGRQLIPRTVHNDRGSAEMSYINIYGFDGNEFEWTADQPIKVPGRRAGLLTHPAWLVAHSTNFDNDVVRRGKWIREKLLAGTIPDVPIDVEAMVPDEPQHGLRHRMRVTREPRCVKCHRLMDPLGFPFELYDHYGHYREKEMVGTRRKMPIEIDPSGQILFSGDEQGDQEVTDAIDLVSKLAKSKRTQQAFVRHAFRYWMGRNEMMSDSQTLINAHQAYAKSQGSFTELLVSLLASDSFLSRKRSN